MPTPARKKPEQKLALKESRFLEYIQNAQNIIFRMDLEGRITFISRFALDSLGLTFDEVVGKGVVGILLRDTPQNRESVATAIREHICHPDTYLRYEVESELRDGSRVWISWMNRTLLDERGNPSEILCVGTEITDRKLIESALLKSEQQYRELVENARSIILRLDMDGRVTFFNEFARSFFGYSEEEIIGRYVVGTIVPQTESSGRDLAGMIEEILHSPERYSMNENENIRRDGSRVWVSWANRAIFDDSGRLKEILCIGIDITERKRAEEREKFHRRQLIQADKMASLGILVSGVAHEINNPNNFILLNAEIIAKAWASITPILREYYDSRGDFPLAGIPWSKANERIPLLISGIRDGAERIEKIVANLKSFTRQDSGDMNEILDMNAVLESALLIVGNLIKKTTNRFTVEYGQGLPTVRGNFQRLEQVVLNLLTNACQALPARDRGITVSTDFDPVSEMVTIAIEDEGVGIPMDDLKHIFDPFFTTKRDSGGTGLGLSISYSIVQEHGGTLEIVSAPGEGTRATMILPGSGGEFHAS